MPYTVASTLSDILNQKKAESRQKLMDDLNKRNVESEMESRAENTRSMAEQRDAQAQQKYLQLLTAGGHEVDEDVSGLDPKMLDVGEKAGLVKHSLPSPIPSVTTSSESDGNQIDAPSTSVQAPLPPLTGKFYKGNPDQIKQARIKSNVGQFQQAMTANPNMSPMDKLMGLYGAFEDQPDASAVAQTLKPDVPDYIVNADDGKVDVLRDPVTHKPVSGAHVTVRSRTPQPVMPFSFLPAVDPATNMPIVGDRRNGTTQTAPVTGGSGQGVVARPSSKDNEVVATDIAGMKTARVALAKAQDTGVGIPEAQQNVVASQNRLISRLPSDTAKDFAKGVLSFPKAGTYDVETLLGMNKPDPRRPDHTFTPLTEQDKAALRNILPYLIGAF